MINLLPQTEKDALRWGERQRMAILLGIILCVFFISLTLVVLIGELHIRGEEESEKILLETERHAFRVTGLEEIRGRAERYQKTFRALVEFFNQRTEINELIQIFSDSLPPSTYFTLFSYEKESGMVRVSGFSPTREDLFLLKQRLEGEKFFKSVDFPPSNWIKSTDINFQATLTIDHNVK